MRGMPRLITDSISLLHLLLVIYFRRPSIFGVAALCERPRTPNNVLKWPAPSATPPLRRILYTLLTPPHPPKILIPNISVHFMAGMLAWVQRWQRRFHFHLTSQPKAGRRCLDCRVCKLDTGFITVLRVLDVEVHRIIPTTSITPKCCNSC